MPSVILLSALFNSSITFAESGCQTPGYLCLTECMNLNTTDRMFCYRDKQNEAEIELNSAYDRLIPLAQKYDPKLEKSLRGAQRAWVKFRELNCHFYDEKDRELRKKRRVRPTKEEKGQAYTL